MTLEVDRHPPVESTRCSKVSEDGWVIQTLTEKYSLPPVEANGWR